jgi:hypothetical protein
VPNLAVLAHHPLRLVPALAAFDLQLLAKRGLAPKRLRGSLPRNLVFDRAGYAAANEMHVSRPSAYPY